MGAGDRVGDVEPEAQALTAAAVVPARTERLEDPRQHRLGNASLVVDLDGDRLPVSREPHVHRRARLAMLYRVRGQVRDRLEDPILVPRAAAIRLAVEGDL